MHKSTLALYSVLIALLVGCVAGEVGEKKVLPGVVALSLSSISPSAGNPTGGTSVTLTGSGFQSSMAIMIGGAPCTITSSSASSATCTTAGHSIGTVDVFVIRSDGDNDTLTNGYTYQNAPTLTSVTPNLGTNTGSTGIALTGTGFLSGATVTVGSLPCSGVTVVGPTSITCTIPSCGASCPYANAVVNVAVTNSDGQASGTQTYTFADTPIVSSVTKNAGALAGGGTIVIAGNYFKPVGVTPPTVDIGGAACVVNAGLTTNTSITCVTSVNTAGAKTVSVTNEVSLTGTLASGFTYQAAPTITSLSLNAGNPTGGYTTTITGTNFDVANGAVISVGGTACTTSSVVSTTSATCQVPAGALGATTLTFVNNDANSQAVAAPPTFTYQNAPTLTEIHDKVLCDASGTPSACTNKVSAGPLAGGRQVYLIGTGFVSGATVTINGTSCGTLTVDSATQITCTTPANPAGTYDVVVTNADGQTVTLSSAYLYRAAPTITSFTPNAGALGGLTSMTINGTGFLAGAVVTFDIGGTPAVCSSPSITSTQITCATVAHVAASVNITVTNTDNQSATSATNYTYQGPPVFTSPSPNGGTINGFQLLTITGSGFDTVNGMSILVGGNTCSSPTVVNPTTVTCTTPTHALGTVDITLTNLDGDSQSVTATNVYTYQSPPSISQIFDKVLCDASGVVPTCTDKIASESINGGNVVYITGSNFLAGATVTIGGNACTAPTVVSSTLITCTTPASATTGAKTLVVTNYDAQTSTKFNAYIYQSPPTITGITPNTGSSAGSGTIVVQGTNFDVANGVTVTVNGNPCSPTFSLTPTSVSCMTPAIGGGALATPYDVVLTLKDGDAQATTSVGSFTYIAAPTVSNISPNVGPTTGGQSVTITGTGFDTANGATVTIAGATCTSPVVVSSTTITCTTGVSTAGTNNVVVTNTDANLQSGTLVSGYTYQIKPIIANIIPSSGALAGGSLVTVNGIGFVDNTITSISINSLPCVVQAGVTYTQLTCITGGPNAEGTYSATVTNSNDGQNSTTANAFTYYAAPTISTIAPSYGPVTGSGPSFRIYGTKFIQIGATVPIIRFDPGGSPVDCATVTVIDSTTLECASTPAHAAGYVTVRVINPDGDAQQVDFPLGFSFWAQPTVASVDIPNGPASGGTNITITGTGFGGATSATVGGVACTSFAIVDANNVTCTTGNKGNTTTIAASDIIVSTFDGQSGTLSSAFTYNPPPRIDTVANTATPTVSAGPLAGGTNITITGDFFVAGATVSVGAVTCTTPVIAATSITCDTGINTAGLKDVVVTNPDGQSFTLSNSFTYRAAPTISGVALSAGALGGGTTITLTGTGFITNAIVDIDPAGTSASCGSVSVVSPTSITCTTSAHAAGTFDVRVTNEEGQAGTLASSYTYQAAPTVGSLSVSNGASGGGTAMTITGTGFLTGATVDFGGSSCGTVVVVSLTSITCTTSTHANGVVTVTVTNADTQSGSLASSFTYQGAPTISGVSPSGGDIAGGTLITISGDQYFAGASVTLDVAGTPAACGGVTVVNINTITCTTVAHAAGPVSVRVLNTDTQAGTLANGFTYRPPPTVSLISPTGGPTAGGTPVTISGANFISGSTVTLGGVACTSPTFVSAATLTCTSGGPGAGLGDVVVTLPDNQTGTLSNGFTYQNPPTVTSLDIITGSTSGGLMITLTGTGFVTGASISLGGVACTSPTYVNATTYTCVTPAKAAGTYSITLTNADSQSATLGSAFTYVSMAQLQWQRGTVSPNPPDPDTFGPAAINITHTYTLKNVGNAVSSTVTVSIGGTNATGWFKGTDTCSSSALAAGASCTVQATFLGGGLPTGAYTATLDVTATSGGSDSNTMNGSVP